jgi:Ser/Thr protein kinase RdoA (MazF antagonist)
MAEQHELLVERILNAMGLTQQLTGHELASEGLSGARTYRVWFDGHEAVLKATGPEAEAWVRERARRELSFYRVLAGQIPLLVPEVLGRADDDIVGTCLLLERYIPSPPPAQWPAREIIEVARQLAGLHAAFWSRHEQLRAHAWLRDLRAPTNEETISQAQLAWRALGSSDPLGELFAPDVYRMLDRGLARLPALDATIRSFPSTLCHGDCHLRNVLRDEHGHLLWTDWAEVGVGAGPADLSFLIQRANVEGADLSLKELSTVYHDQLADAVDPPISLGAIHRVVDAFELRTLLLDWPHYLGWASTETVSNLLARIHTLAAHS